MPERGLTTVGVGVRGEWILACRDPGYVDGSDCERRERNQGGSSCGGECWSDRERSRLGGHKAKAPAVDRSAQLIVCRLICQEDRWWSSLRLEVDARRSRLLIVIHGWRKSQREETGSQTELGTLPLAGASHTRRTQPRRQKDQT